MCVLCSELSHLKRTQKKSSYPIVSSPHLFLPPRSDLSRLLGRAGTITIQLCTSTSRGRSTFGGPFAFRPCDGFATMHGDMLMFRARHHGAFSSAHITRSQLVRRNQQAHCTHPAPHPLWHVAQPAFFQCPFCAFSTATLPHTDTLTAQDTRTANHGYNTLVRFECDFKPFMLPCDKHLTVAAESRPFLALRYESRPPLPLRDSCDEDCATQGSMDDQSLCEALARYLDSRYAGEFEVLANSLN